MTERPDPDAAPLLELDRELARLVKRYGMASHVVGEQGGRPNGIDDDTLAWWVAAHRAAWRRRFEIDTSSPKRQPGVDPAAPLRRERRRDPYR
ncbi:MAG TPA: hypothetical protein VNQ73_09360 [Ilumatobacter sp.]|nr:hypothetical protein [Ilumatobacter sp.]